MKNRYPIYINLFISQSIGFFKLFLESFFLFKAIVNKKINKNKNISMYTFFISSIIDFIIVP